MEDKQQQPTSVVSGTQVSPNSTNSPQSTRRSAVSFLRSQRGSRGSVRLIVAVITAVLILVGGFYIFLTRDQHRSPTTRSAQPASNYDTQNIPLDGLADGSSLGLNTAQSLSINGQLRTNGAFILTPGARPQNAVKGQIYFDTTTNTPYIYDGSNFVGMSVAQAVQSIGGQVGSIALGPGLLLQNGQLSLDSAVLEAANAPASNPVTSVQGQTGAIAFSSGTGITINGTTIGNSGVVSIQAASPQLAVTQGANGAYTIGVVGNFATATGTPGQIAVFDSASNLTDSIMSQVGSLLTVSGDIQVTGQARTNTISLLTPGQDLNISAGSDDIVFTSGGRTFQLPSAGAVNQTICTVGMDCTTGGGAVYVQLQPSVIQQDTGASASIYINNTGGGELLHLQGNSVDAFVVDNDGNTTISGDLTVSGAINGATVNNANISGGTITGANINNASITGGSLTDTSVNGLTITSDTIAADGALTISTANNQNLNLNTVGTGIVTVGSGALQGAGALTLAAGGVDQNLTLTGSGLGNVIVQTPVFRNANGASYTFDASDLNTVNATICTSVGNCVGSGGAVGGSGTAGTVALWTGTGFTLTDSLLSQSAGVVTVTGDLSANNLQGNGSGLTNVNAVSLNGQAGSFYQNASNLNTGTLSDSRLSANVAKYNDATANFTGNLQENGNDVCTTAGNCAGTGAGVGGSGTAGVIAVWNGSGFTIGDSLLTQDTTAGTVTVAGDVIATGFIGDGSGLTNVNAATFNGQAASYYLNASNISSGTLNDARLSGNVAKYSDSVAAFLGSGSFVGTVSGADAVNTDDFVTLSQLNAAVGGVGGGVSSLNSLASDLIIQGTVGQITVNDDGVDTITLALDSAVTLQGNTFNGANQLVQLNASGFLPALNGSLLTNVNAATLQGQAGSYYLDLANATGTLNIARIADASLTNAKLANSSLTVTAGNGLVNGGSVALGGTVAINVGAGDGISVTADAIAVDSTVCRTSGNCLGSGGAVSGSGTAGTIAVWDGSGFSLTDSIITQTGTTDITVGGNLTATNLNGAGAGITSLNASNVASGTLSDARLSSNVTLQGNTFNGASQLVQLNASGQLPALNGSLLTNLNASNVSSGMLSDARLSGNVALLNASANFTGTLQQGGNDVCTTAGNCVGSGGGGAVGGSGTAGTIAVWDGSGFTIGDSLLSQNSGTILLSGSGTGTISTAGTNQTLTLQGNGTGGVTILVPTFENANGATYSFDAADAGTVSATICTTAGNCVGSGGAVGGSGTAGTIALWTGSGFTLTDSLATQSGGTVTISGDLVATNLQGNGSSVTDVNAAQLGGQSSSYYTNATNISSGTLADARLSTNVTLQGNTFNGANQLVRLTGTGLLPVLDGSNLTNVNAQTLDGLDSTYFTNATNITSGTLGDGRLSANVALFDAATANFTGTLQQGGNDVCTTAGNCLGSGGAVSGSGTAGTIAVWNGSGFTIGDSLLSQNAGVVTVAGDLAATNLQGNGSNVTNVDAVALGGQGAAYYLNASNINAGTLADARLSVNVTTAGNTFNGANQLVQLNASGQLPALDGSLLTGLNASNIASGTLNDARLSSNIPRLNATANFTGALQQGGNDVCTVAGNCVGVSGGAIGGSGTANTLAMFNGSGYTIANSIVSQNVAGTVLTVSGQLTATTGAAITGNSTIIGTLTGLTGLTSSGTITFSGLNAAGVVHTDASGILSTSLIQPADLSTGTYTAITGTGALDAGSITSGFGAIDTGADNITTTGTITGGTINATSNLQTNGTTRLDSAGALQNITGYSQTSGNFSQSGTGTFSTGTGAVSLNGSTTVSGALTVNAGNMTTLQGGLTVNGTQFTNNASTLNTALSLGNFATGGSIGTAVTTVDIKTSIAIAQTTAGQTLSLPSPTVATAGRVVYILNTGTTGFTMQGITVPSGYGQMYLWNGSAWILGATGGGSAITLQGAYDGGNTLNTTDARSIEFTLSNTATDANFVTNIASGSTGQFKIQNNGTDILTMGSAGQLGLSVQGASGGIAIGGDTQLYRSGANRLTMTNALTLRNTTDSTTALQIQNAVGVDVLTVDTANGRIGIGTNPSYKLHVADTTTANSGTSNTGAYFSLTVNPSSAPAGITTYYGQQTLNTSSSANLNANVTMYGDVSTVQNAGSANLGAAVGAGAIAQNSGTGTIGNAIGGRFKASNIGAGSITNGVALQASTPEVTAGSIGTAYGLFIETQAVSGVGTGVGIWQAGASDLNVFAGKVGIGVVPSSYALEVNGTGSFGTSVLTPTLDTATATALNVGTANATQINLNKNVVVAASQSLTITGGATGTRPASPTEGMIYYDTTTKQLLTYANGKWQADRTESVIVAASNSSQADKDAADYVADGNTAGAGDGDQVQINAALTAGSGKKVVLLAGTYVADATILIPNNTTLAGVGRGTLVELADLDASDNLIENSDTSTGTGVVIQDLRLSGRKDLNTAGTQYGLYMDGMGSGSGASAVPGAKVTKVFVESFRSTGIYLNTSLNNAITESTMLANTSTGITVSGSSNNIFANNIIQGTSAQGILLIASSNGNTLTGNNVEGSNTRGIVVDGSSYNTVTGNTSNTNVEGIRFVNASNHNTVTGNTARANTTYGIAILSSDSNTISGNRSYDNGGSTTNNGIYLTNADSNTITGNAITDSSATTNNYAINVVNSTSDTNYLADNTLGGGSINDAGTGTVYGGQVNAGGNYQIQPAGTIELMKNTNVTGTLSVSGATTLSSTLSVGGLSTLAGFTSTANSLVRTTSTTAFQIQNGASSVLLTADTTNMQIIIGNGGNTVTLSSTSGVTLAGTARRTKTILLTPEYVGAVLDAADDSACASANSGTMFSGLDPAGRMNYYQWRSTQGTAQCYDVVIQVPIPSDWDAWAASSPISAQLKRDSTGTGAYAIKVLNSSGATDTTFCAGGYCSPGTLGTSWADMAAGTTLAGTGYTAGDYLTIKVRLSSTSSANVYLGNIKLSYMSKY